MKVKGVKASAKKLEESKLSSLIKDLHSLGELIRAKQEEKQALIDEFNSENRRFLVGKLSQRTVKSSIKKTREEMKRLNSEIKETIKGCELNIKKINALISAQTPKRFGIGLAGIKEPKMKGGKKK